MAVPSAAVIWLSYRGLLDPIPLGCNEKLSTAVRDVLIALSNQYIQPIHDKEMQNVSVEIDGDQKSLHQLGGMLVASYLDHWIPIFISGRHTGIFFKLI